MTGPVLWAPSFCSGGRYAMMGFKDRSFAPLPTDLSLEELVPRDNFYRRLEAELDLSFVRDLVRPLYASGGATFRGPGRLLQAPARHVLRGHPLRAAARGGRGG